MPIYLNGNLHVMIKSTESFKSPCHCTLTIENEKFKTQNSLDTSSKYEL